MKNLSWKEKFNIPADSDHSIVEILRSGFISEEDYLAWASEAYQIPVVDHEFFKTVNNHRLVLENPSELWCDTFFPAYEWENTLFIVCLEPQELQINKPHCFVLASLFRMETLWTKMEKPLPESEALTLPKDDETPVENTMASTSADVEEKLTSPDFSFDSLALHQDSHEDSSSEKPQEAADSTEVIANMDFNITDMLGQSSLAENEEPTPPPVIAPEPAVSAPSFAKMATAIPSVSAKDSGGQNVYEDSKITNLFAKTDSSNQITIPDFIIEELLKPEEKPLMEDTVNTQSFDQREITNVVALKQKPEITFTNTKTIMPFPERSTHFSFVRTVFSEQIILEARGKVKENTDPHQALISAFHILKDYYKKLMWAVRDQKGAVYAIASNTAWDFSEEAWNTPIDFKSPNPFRIAKFTAKPYHGKVYPNPINDRFFELWNAGKYPPVLSIVPIKLQGKVFAYFIGCEPALHYHPTNSLDIMQATCEELIHTFLTIHKELTPKAS